MGRIDNIYRSLSGKRVVVTGGASGIGLATVERFRAEGARVAVIDTNEQRLSTLRLGGAIDLGVCADVSVAESVHAAFDQVLREWDGLDVLVANAGVSVRAPLLAITPEQWRVVLATNLHGAFYCAQRAGQEMIKRENGVILFTASTNALEGHALYADYNASKAGMLLLMRTMALELAPTVRVNAVSPGYVLTPMQLAEYTPEMLAQVNQRLPLKRHAEPSEVAALFAFLASDEAQYLTGQNFIIDGGETA
jgi:meso-butanediol dehydrogenase/(S,S)-butanediol dehydrogenase/diacetyl reductase